MPLPILMEQDHPWFSTSTRKSAFQCTFPNFLFYPWLAWDKGWLDHLLHSRNDWILAKLFRLGNLVIFLLLTKILREINSVTDLQFYSSHLFDKNFVKTTSLLKKLLLIVDFTSKFSFFHMEFFREKYPFRLQFPNFYTLTILDLRKGDLRNFMKIQPVYYCTLQLYFDFSTIQ